MRPTLYTVTNPPNTTIAAWMAISTRLCKRLGSRSWKKRMRTWMRLRLASTQPNTASQTMKKRDSSSVQISGSPSARVTTPSATQTRSAATIPQATIAAAVSKPRAKTRSIGLPCAPVADANRGAPGSRGRDALPEALAPFRLELRGHAGQNRLAEALDVRLEHGHAAGLERVSK